MAHPCSSSDAPLCRAMRPAPVYRPVCQCGNARVISPDASLCRRCQGEAQRAAYRLPAPYPCVRR